ncbi:MAG: AEC family transporter [Candidatus Omnitrophota bacterium]
MTQIFLMGAIGFFLIRRKILLSDGLGVLSKLVIEITLPIFIFCSIIRDFSFAQYPNWWMLPVSSLLITGLGLLVGCIILGLDKGIIEKRQFISLIAFQNSGYLPLPLVGAMFPEEQARVLFIYIFLFLLGFNLVIWSFGVWLIAEKKTRNFELGSLFSPPVIATLIGLLFIGLGINKWIPAEIYNPLKMLGDCTLPLAIVVVGGNLGGILLKKGENTRQMFYMILAKLIILPLAVWLILLRLPVSGPIKFLLLVQAAMPPATNLSVICSHYKIRDQLITEGVFWGHLVSIITIPIILALSI